MTIEQLRDLIERLKEQLDVVDTNLIEEDVTMAQHNMVDIQATTETLNDGIANLDV